MKVQFNSRISRAPDVIKGVQVPYAPPKRKVAQLRWYLILLVVSSPLLYLLYTIVKPLLVTTALGYVAMTKVSVNSAASGYVDKIPVRVGDTVSKDQDLVQLADPTVDERERALRAELSALQNAQAQQYTAYRNSPRIAKFQENVRIGGIELKYQEEKVRKVDSLYRKGAATIAELNQAESQLRMAQYTLNQAKSDLALAEGDYAGQLHSDQKQDMRYMAEREPRIKRIEAELSSLGPSRDRLVQKAPIAGRVLDVLVEEGRHVAPGAPLVILGEATTPYVMAFLDPKDIRYARLGQTARVHFPDGTSYDTEVSQVLELTQRVPEELIPPLISRQKASVIVRLDLKSALPAGLGVYGLPVTVRFSQSYLPPW